LFTQKFSTELTNILYTLAKGDVMDQEEELDYFRKHEIKELELFVNLIEDSPEFKKIYENERKNIKKPVIWVQSSCLRSQDQLAEGYFARANFLQTGEVLVIVRNNPSLLQDSSIIAHELAHLLIDAEGFPQVGRNPRYENDVKIVKLAFLFNNMIQDPMVVTKLLSYGYDLRGEYLDECKDLSEKLKSPAVPKEDLGQVFLAFMYVQCVLENRLLFKKEKTECSKNILTMFSKLNHIALKGKKMLKIVDKHGMEDPESVKKIYEEIINSFDLSEYMMVYYKSQ